MRYRDVARQDRAPESRRRVVLIVEHDALRTALLRRVLDREAVALRVDEVVVTADGVAARDYLFNVGTFAGRSSLTAPVAILLGMSLSGITGIDLLRRIRSRAATARVPVVMLAGSQGDVDVVRAYGFQVDEFIRTDVDAAAFARAVVATLTRLTADPSGK